MLKKIPVSEVRVGMYLHELVGSSWLSHPFWKTKFVIQDAADLQRLQTSSVTAVWIDVALGLDTAPASAETAAATAEPAPAEADAANQPAAPPAPRANHRRVTIEQEVERAKLIKQQAKQEVGALFQQARLGQAISSAHLAPLVEEISASVHRNPGVFVSLARLKNKDDYTYLHSVTVCALMVALGRQLGLEEDQLRDAGMAGLLHDLGKARIPLEILNKPGKLTDEEFAVIRQHPRYGYDMLAGQGGASEAAMDVSLHHHEKFNGEGYPDRLSGTGISLFSRMGAVCDVYDAITSNRPYKSGWEPSESIRRMALWSKEGHFDPKIFQAFVKSIGIYPTGSLVRLQSGRLAVVLEQHESSALTPSVKAFFSIKSNMRITPEVIDLSKPDIKERITGRELPEDWKITNLEEIWAGPGAVQKS